VNIQEYRRQWHMATSRIPHDWKTDGVDVVVDMPDGKSYPVSSIRYEEDLAGAVVLRVDSSVGSQVLTPVVTWQSRWSKSEGPVVAVSQQGHDVHALNLMWSVHFDLRNTEDVQAIVRNARAFADLIEQTKADYDDATGAT
jgi:hypothetical protein